jgi:O-antigen ligase
VTPGSERDEAGIAVRNGPWPTRARVVAWAWILVFTLEVVIVSGTYSRMGSPVARTGFHLLLAVLLAGWLVAAAARAEWRPDVRTTAAVCLPLAAAAVATAASAAPRIATEGFTTGIAWALIFLLATRLGSNPWFRPRVAGLLTLIVAVTLVAYLAQVALAWIRWWQLTGVPSPPLRPEAVSLTFGASPIVAGLILILGPLALLRARDMPMGRLLVAVGLIGGIAAIVITGSRAAYLGLAVAVVVSLVLYAAGRARADGIRRLATSNPVPVLAAGAVVAVGGVLLTGRLAARLFDSSTIVERFDIWRSAIVLFQSSPVVGTGPGTWPVLKYAVNPDGVRNLVVPHAHSIPIQTLSDLGVVGLVALAVFCAFVFRRLVLARRSAEPTLRAAGSAAIVAMAGFVALSLFEDFANLGTILLPLALLCGLVVGQTDGPAEGGRARLREPVVRATAVLAATVALAVGGWWLAGSDAAALTADRGRMAADRGDWAEATRLFEEAFRADPDMPLYRMESAVGLAIAGRTDEAATRLAPVVRVEGSSVNLLSLAWYEALLGRDEDSLGNARLAMRRGADDPLVALNVGALAGRAGDAQLSIDAYAQAMTMTPEIAMSRDLGALDTRDAIVARALELARSGQPGTGSSTAALILAYTGDLPAGQAELARVAAGADRTRVQATLDWLGDRRSQAIDALRAALNADPGDGNTALQLARFLQAEGNPESARYFDWASLVGFGSVASSSAAGSSIQAARVANSSDTPANYPWMLYLRNGPLLITSPDYLVVR